MTNEIYEHPLFEDFETYYSNPRNNQPIRQTKNFDVNNRQSVRNSKVDLKTLSNNAVSHQKDGWTIKKMFDPTYLSPNIDWTHDENERFKGTIVDFQMVRGTLNDGYECYYLNVIYLVNIPDVGIRLVRQDNLSANFTSGSNLAKYLFTLGFNLFEMQEFDPKELIGIDVWVGIGRNESNFFTVNYVEKFGN